MKKIFFVLLAVGMSLSSANVLADKIGVIDLQKIITTSAYAKKKTKVIINETTKRSKAFSKKVDAFKAKQEKFQKDSLGMTQAKRDNVTDALEKEQKNLQREETDLRDWVKKEQEKLVVDIQTKAQKIVDSVGAKEKYDVIMFQGIAYFNKSIDLTDRVSKALK